MSGRSTTRYVLLGALGLVAAVFLALLVLTPIEIRSEAVRTFLETKVADALGGRFSYERLRVSILPRPCVSLLGVAFAKDPNLAATAAEVSLCPQLLPLLRGELRPARIRAHAPDIRFSGPLLPAGGGSSEEAIAPRAAQALALLTPGGGQCGKKKGRSLFRASRKPGDIQQTSNWEDMTTGGCRQYMNSMI